MIDAADRTQERRAAACGGQAPAAAPFRGQVRVVGQCGHGPRARLAYAGAWVR